MTFVRLFAIAVLFALAGSASAQRSLQSVGYRQIEMPYPEGYVSTRGYYPDVVRTMQTRMPQQLELLDVFVTRADFEKLQAKQTPTFERMVQLHLMKPAEDKAVSAEGFDEMTKALEESLKKTPGADFASAPRREANALTYGLKVGPSYVANRIINANFQVLNLIAYAPAGEASAADATLSRWADAIRSENPETGEFRDRAGRIDVSAMTGSTSGGSGRTEESAPYRIGYWLGIALFIYIVYRIFIRKRT